VVLAKKSLVGKIERDVTGLVKPKCSIKLPEKNEKEHKNGGPKWGFQMGVPKWGPKSGSQKDVKGLVKPKCLIKLPKKMKRNL
jgi:hypothetical protein